MTDTIGGWAGGSESSKKTGERKEEFGKMHDEVVFDGVMCEFFGREVKRV